jgi:hypothetical protein
MSHIPPFQRPRSVPFAGSPALLSAACAAALCALCGGAGCLPTESGSGSGGTGGGTTATTLSTTTSVCTMTPQPTFALRVLAAEGAPVPPDTTVEVMWSAGTEPVFHLDQPSTWGTLETSSLVCDVDPSQPAPVGLPVLTCALWTSSPTDVKVSAAGYVTKDHTYTADPQMGCEPNPTPIEIKLFKDHPN